MVSNHPASTYNIYSKHIGYHKINKHIKLKLIKLNQLKVIKAT